MSDLIDPYLRSLRAAGFAAETIRSRGAVLRALADFLPDGLDHPTLDEIEAWLAGPVDQDGTALWSRWTRYTYWEHANSYYTWAIARGHLSWSPMDQLVRPTPPRCEPRPATEEQVAAALALLPWPWVMAVMLASFESLRAGEIARLAREDIDQRYVATSRKYAREQVLPTHPLVWAEVRDRPPGPLLRTSRGTPFSRGYLSTSTSQQLARIGLKPLTLHWFRHRFATIALLPKDRGGAGADVRTVQELMGHASVRSTQSYTLVTSQQRADAVAGLPMPPGVR